MIFYVLVEGHAFACRRYVVNYKAMFQEWEDQNEQSDGEQLRRWPSRVPLKVSHRGMGAYQQQLEACRQALEEVEEVEERAARAESAWEAYNEIKITYQSETIEGGFVNAEWPPEDAIRTAQNLLAAKYR